MIDLDAECPKCGGLNTNSTALDEVEFCPDGTGHYFVDKYCLDCGNVFRMCYNFTYKITKAWTQN